MDPIVRFLIRKKVFLRGEGLLIIIFVPSLTKQGSMSIVLLESVLEAELNGIIWGTGQLELLISILKGDAAADV